jgi:hypothetical protein
MTTFVGNEAVLAKDFKTTTLQLSDSEYEWAFPFLFMRQLILKLGMVMAAV